MARATGGQRRPLAASSDAARAQKRAGAYYSPDAVVASLVAWAVRRPQDRLLDPACGDGRFIAAHPHSVGIEQDAAATQLAIARAPGALVHEGEFFAWAQATTERFDCAVGNPPFIRYQRFAGAVRDGALSLCARLGAKFSGLTSSWAPFLVATASLLKPGGRMAFVVPAELGHAPYAAPVLEYLVAHFSTVHVLALRSKLFPDLSEDCWLLFADGFGGRTETLLFSAQEKFVAGEGPPRLHEAIPVGEWRTIWGRRLRPYLMSAQGRALYQSVVTDQRSQRLADFAQVGIGYITGANDFFHLSPSEARRHGLPAALLQPSVRNGRALIQPHLTPEAVRAWIRSDRPVLLLRLEKRAEVPASVRRYLDGADGRQARLAYKCRVREPWYAVPDVQIPDFFLSYMSGTAPSLVRNDAGCACTNSVHGVRVGDPVAAARLFAAWDTPLLRLSCEVEGHPLGGGMLKLEPREAGRIVLPREARVRAADTLLAREAVAALRAWRHCVAPA